MIHLVASQPHYLDWLRPIADALTARGVDFLLVPQRIQLADDGTPTIIAGMADASKVPHSRPLALMDHGIGQRYMNCEHASYNGGERRERVSLFLYSSPGACAVNQARWPDARHAVVGPVRLDKWVGTWPRMRSGGPITILDGAHRVVGHLGPVVAFAWHFPLTIVPETQWAWPYYAPVIERLAADSPYTLLGHAHPKAWESIEGHYDRLGIEQVRDPDEVFARADLVCFDNTCVAPDTPVLCADLRWRAAGSLEVGDELIACDEERSRALDTRYGKPCMKEERLFRTATVLANPRRSLPCAEVRTTHGSLTVSLDHPWLARRSHRVRNHLKKLPNQVKWNTRQRWEWVKTSDLAVDDEVAFIAPPWEDATSRDAGWLAGLFDGEGNLHTMKARPSSDGGGGRQSVLSVAQNPGAVVDELHRVCAELNIKTVDQKITGKGCRKFTVNGGAFEILRVLGTLRPVRLLAHAMTRRIWEGWSVSAQVEKARVVSIVAVGDREVCVLGTSERTFIAGGFMAHNSFGYEAAAVGIPVLALDAPFYRDQPRQPPRFYRDVPGLRLRAYRDQAPECGIVHAQWGRDHLAAAIEEALDDRLVLRGERERVVSQVYGDTLDGRASERAADAIEEWAT